jgi:hypothetical protein
MPSSRKARRAYAIYCPAQSTFAVGYRGKNPINERLLTDIQVGLPCPAVRDCIANGVRKLSHGGNGRTHCEALETYVREQQR